MEYAFLPYLLEGPSGEELVLEWRGKILGCASNRPIVAFTVLSSEYHGSEIFEPYLPLRPRPARCRGRRDGIRFRQQPWIAQLHRVA